MSRRSICWLTLLSVMALAGANAFGFSAGIDPSLMGWWKLEEGSGNVANDSSGNNNNGTVNGNPAWVAAGKIGGCIDFDGTNDYIDCGNSASLSPTDGITLAVWLKTPGMTTTWAVFISKGDTGSSFRLGRNGTGTSVHFGLNGVTASGNPWFDGTRNVSDNEWHHVAGTYDGTTMRLWVDGTQDTTLAATGKITVSSTRVYISENADSAGRYFKGMMDDVRVYNRALTQDELAQVMVGSTSVTATKPDPSDGETDVARDAALSWVAGPFGVTRDIYFGSNFDDVNNATTGSPLLASASQSALTFDPAGVFAYGQTYYWRVDEVNGTPDKTVYKGSTWSFTAEPYGYPVKPAKATASSSMASTMGPDKTIDGSGLDSLDQHGTSATAMWMSKKNQTPIWIQYEFDKAYKLYQMWVWNSNQAIETVVGFGAKDVTVETSLDGTTWTALAGVAPFEQATGEPNYVHNTTVDFGGLEAKFVKLTIANNWADSTKQSSLGEVRFFYVPVKAFYPAPVSGASDIAVDASLNWRPGRLAGQHKVYVSADANAVANGTAPVQTVSDHKLALAPLGLTFGKTYYWRVDEVNDAVTPSSFEGDVWSFTTIGYAVVEDFESYNDVCKRIFFGWIDGYGHNGSTDCGIAPSLGNATGSTVGNVNPPFAEGTIIHGGGQSMPMAFDNTKSPFYSEAQTEWAQPQAWTNNGVANLVLYVRGQAPAFLETSPGTILMNGAGTDVWDAADQFRFVYKSLKGNGSIIAKVESIGRAHEWSKAGVMIRESTSSGSTHAFNAATPTATHGISFQRRITPDTATNANTDVADTALPQWVKVTRNGSTFTAQYSADGKAWTDVVTTAPVTIDMANDVLIGLAVSSHVAGTATGAKFSNVTTTGNVSGSWQTAEIGATQVAGNTPESFYVMVQDSAGKSKVVSNPDPSIIATGSWQEWSIPLSEFSSAGLNLGSIKKLVIGVGDRNSPKAGGSGSLYIDDIRLTPAQ